MAKFAIDAGHGVYPDIGAEGYLNEQDCALDISLKVINKLKLLNHEAWMVRPESASSILNSLQQRCDSAAGADCLVSIHLNAGGGRGSEVFALSQEGYRRAEKVQEELISLGFTNRGVKDGSNLYIIKNSKPVAILIEVCFVDSPADRDLFNSLDNEKIAAAIVKGLTKSSVQQGLKDNSSNIIHSITIKQLQQYLNRLKITDYSGNKLVEDDILGYCTKTAVKRFQNIMDLESDGIVGVNTREALNQIFFKPLCGLLSTEFFATRYIQWRIGASIDGIFGNITATTVRAWQGKNGLIEDGIVGKNTWVKLIG